MAAATGASVGMDAQMTLFSHISSNPQALIDKAYHVQHLVEQGASINEAAHDAPLILGARAFARAHFDNLPSPVRNRGRAFSLNPKVKGRKSSVDQPPASPVGGSALGCIPDGTPDNASFTPGSPSTSIAVDPSVVVADGAMQARRQRSKSGRRMQSTGTLRKQSLGPRMRSSMHRSKSRRRIEERMRSSTENAEQLKEQLVHLASRASELEEAQKRFVRLEEQTATGSSRLSRLEHENRELVESKEKISAELSSLKDSRTSELRDTRGKVESLEHIMADQASQISLLTSKLVGDLSQLEASGCTIRGRVGKLAVRAESPKDELLEHEVDLSGLQNVCAALYSQETALELDALAFAANESSLALLADLARRFPLCAARGAALCSEDACLQVAAFDENASRPVSSDTSWWEPVD